MTKQEITDLEQIALLKCQTHHAILHGHKGKVKELYQQVERHFINGGDSTRSLIANSFIFPVAQLLEMNYSWGCEYLNLFPVQLKAEYCRQINSSGI